LGWPNLGAANPSSFCAYSPCIEIEVMSQCIRVTSIPNASNAATPTDPAI
jgi:hypothetical protein